MKGVDSDIFWAGEHQEPCHQEVAVSSCLRSQSQDTELIESRVSERWLEVWNSS